MIDEVDVESRIATDSDLFEVGRGTGKTAAFGEGLKAAGITQVPRWAFRFFDVATAFSRIGTVPPRDPLGQTIKGTRLSISDMVKDRTLVPCFDGGPEVAPITPERFVEEVAKACDYDPDGLADLVTELAAAWEKPCGELAAKKLSRPDLANTCPQEDDHIRMALHEILPFTPVALSKVVSRFIRMVFGNSESAMEMLAKFAGKLPAEFSTFETSSLVDLIENPKTEEEHRNVACLVLIALSRISKPAYGYLARMRFRFPVLAAEFAARKKQD